MTKVVQLDPNSASAHVVLAEVLAGDGRTNEAITHLKETLRLRPDWVGPMNNLAWILATHKDSKLRNPDEATRLAQRACELTSYENPGLLDTLAAAYAAEGRFSEAVTTAEKALELAKSSGENQMAEEIQNHLQLYKAGQPYFEKPSAQDKLIP